MPGESVKDLVVKLAFEHGDTKAQISAIRNELKLLDSGFAASAAMAAGMSQGLNQTGSAADQLRAKLSAQQQLVEKYGTAIEQANEKLAKSQARYKETGASLDQLKAKYAEQDASIKGMEAALKELEAEGMKGTSVYAEMAAELEQLKAAHKETGDAVKQAEAAHARADKAVAKNAQAVQKLTIEQNNAKAAMAQTSAALQQEEGRLQRNAAAWEKASEAAGKFAANAKSAGERQVRAGKTLTRGSMAIVGAGVAAAKAAIDWESSFAGVRKTVDGTEEDLQKINDALLSMEVPTDYAELADIAANAGQLGIATENVVGFTRTMADLAETTDLTAESAAQGFAQYANITQMPQENIDRLGSVTVALGNNLATTESKIVNFAQAIGAAGHQAGMTDQQIFGISGGLASLGLEAQAGGTAFSKAIIGMKVAAEIGSEDLKKYADVAGMTSEQFKQAFAQDAAGTFIKFVQGLSTGSKSAIVMLDEMGVTETRFRDMLLRASNASSLMTKSIDLANTAWTENNALQNEAAVRYGTTESRMKMAGKQAQRVAMDFGKAIMPAVEMGLDGVGSIVEKFGALNDAQRASIVKWAAYAAAVGPAVTLLGKANTAIGTVAQGFSSLAGAVASGGGLAGFMSSLGGLLGPAGIAALIAGLGLATYKLYDYASGAQAAREAQEQLNKVAKEWSETEAQTMYDTGNSDPLARFGLTKDSFTGGAEAAQDWMDSLITTWTDGKAETNEILKQYVDGFKSGSDDVRGAIEGQKDLLGEYGALTPEAQANLDRDLKQLDAYDKEVEGLLKKRQNGLLSDEDKARLNEILEARAEIQVKYEVGDGGGYDQVITGMRAEIERTLASGGEIDPTLFGDTMNALAEGRKAYMDTLDASYDAEYANIQLIEDETARQAALNALNERYNEQRQQGEEDYASAVQEAGKTAWEEGGYTEQVKQIDDLLAREDPEKTFFVADIADFTQGLDEGKLASMLSLVEQLKASGMSDQELLDLGINTKDLYEKIDAIKQLSEGVEGLEELGEMFGSALPEEIQRIMVGLDMTQAAADWEAFAEGKSLSPTVELEETEIDLTGNVSDITWPTGSTYQVDAQGNITSVTTASGTVFTVNTQGNITGVTAPSGFTVDVGGNVTGVNWPENAEYEVDAEGNITAVHADGMTFTVDGSGKVTSVTVATEVTLPTLSTAASVVLSPLDQAAIAAWEQANSGITLTGPKAKVGVQLGAGWTSELKSAYDQGMLAIYGADGAKLPVTPEVVKQITANDVAMVGEDGTLHVIITPDVGSQEGLEQSEAGMHTTGLTGTALEPLSRDAQGAIDNITQLAQVYDDLMASMQKAKDNGGMDEFGVSANEYADQAAAEFGALQQSVDGLAQSEPQLTAIGERIANLMGALESGEGTPEQLEGYRQELTELLSFVDEISGDDYGDTGEMICAGIAQGMAGYAFSGDAATVGEAIKSAINSALGVASPATTMVPTGGFVAAGIGQGMRQYAFGGDAAAVSTSIVGAFRALPAKGQVIGNQFGAGLAAGLRARIPGIIAQAQAAANQIAAAFRAAWQIHSPSRVAEGLTEMFGAGLEKGMEHWPTISERVLENDVAAARRGLGSIINNNTDARDMSVSAPIQVEHLEVRDDRDINSLAGELYSRIRRDQRMTGG